MPPNPPAPSQNEVPETRPAVLPKTLPKGVRYRTRRGEFVYSATEAKLCHGHEYWAKWSDSTIDTWVHADSIDWSSVAALAKPPTPQWNPDECAACGCTNKPRLLVLGRPWGPHAGASVCDDCLQSNREPDLLHWAIRSRRSRPAQSRGGEGASAEWLAGARWLCEQNADVAAVYFSPDERVDWFAVNATGGMNHLWTSVINRDVYTATHLLFGDDPALPKDAARFTRAELMAGAPPPGANPTPDPELTAAAFPDSLQSRFPESWRDRCAFCSDLIGSHESTGVRDLGLVHVHCAEQLKRRELAAVEKRTESQRSMRYCMTGDPYRLDKFGVVSSEAFIEAETRRIDEARRSAGSDRVADVGGGHPSTWPEQAYDDVGEL